MLLLSLFLFVLTLLSMQLFGTELTRETRSPVRSSWTGDGAYEYGGLPRSESDTMRFDGFGWALIECFLVIAGEGWSSRMYAVMEHTGNGAAAVFYVFIVIFGQYALLNLTLAIMLDASSSMLSVDLENQKYRTTILNLFAKQYQYIAFHRWRSGRPVADGASKDGGPKLVTYSSYNTAKNADGEETDAMCRLQDDAASLHHVRRPHRLSAGLSIRTAQ